MLHSNLKNISVKSLWYYIVSALSLFEYIIFSFCISLQPVGVVVLELSVCYITLTNNFLRNDGTYIKRGIGMRIFPRVC